MQAVVVLSLIVAVGLALGKIHIGGISLGVTFVFFTGILAGHFGLSIDDKMLAYAESFGLVIFIMRFISAGNRYSRRINFSFLRI